MDDLKPIFKEIRSRFLNDFAKKTEQKINKTLDEAESKILIKEI
jgi:hypothetical protein